LGTESFSEKQQNIVTFETEEAKNAIKLLKMFTEIIPGSFSPYVEKTTLILTPLLEFTMNQNIRKSVSQIFPKLIKCIKLGSNTNRML